ncbi:MAG: phage tail protein [Candidatus Thiodiazotropha endolucinida]|nr:phage tail protein [Candidatus Thiodiazotropha taylori]MCW4324071.1 phage tail protein [Candidatus Thiodiazotropha taylori]
MGMTTALLVGVGLLLGKLIKPIRPPKPKLSNEIEQTDYSTGFSSVSVDTTTPVPLVFGNVKVKGNLIKGYRLGDYNSRLLGVLAIGENIGPSTLNSFSVGGIRFDDLQHFSNDKLPDTTWYEYLPSGKKDSVFIQNSGTKPIYKTLDSGETFISEPIQIFGDGRLLLRFELQWRESGSSFLVTCETRAKGQTEWTLEKEFESEERTTIGNEDYPGTKKIDLAFNASRGVFLFRVRVQRATLKGSVYINNIKVESDTGDNISISAPECACVLFHLVKTNEFSRLNLQADVTFPYENPAEAVKFMLSSKEFGVAGEAMEVDLNSFSESAGFCANNNYEIGVSFTNASYDEAIELILKSARLMLIKQNMVFKLIPDRYIPPGATINVAEHIFPGSLSYGTADRRDIPNRLRVRYTDRVQMGNRNDIIIENTDAITEEGKVREKLIELPAIQSMSMAQDVGQRIFMDETAGRDWVKFEVSLHFGWLEPGISTIKLVNKDQEEAGDDGSDWGGEPWEHIFRIVRLDELKMEDGRFGYSVLAESHLESNYTSAFPFRVWNEPEDEIFSGTIGSSDLKTSISSVRQDVVLRYYLSEDGCYIPFNSVDRPYQWDQVFGVSNRVYVIELTVEFHTVHTSNLLFFRLYGRESGRESWTLVKDEISKDAKKTKTSLIGKNALILPPETDWELIMLYVYDDNGIRRQSAIFDDAIHRFTTKSLPNDNRFAPIWCRGVSDWE